MSKPAVPVKGNSDRQFLEGLPPVEIYFDARDGSYLYKLNGRYISMKKGEIRDFYLKPMGYRDDMWRNGMCEINVPFVQAQNERMIDYSGALAGHKVGLFKDSARGYLVTEQAAGVWDDYPKKMERPDWLLRFFAMILPDDQWVHFLHWLRCAFVSLRAGDFRPGQAVVFAGDGGTGKSLLQLIITEVVGGRAADPFRYMMGETQFNKDLCGAEHWMIQDPPSTTDMRTRRFFGAKMKECTVNRDFSIHQKGKDALSLPLSRRLSISVNGEPENLAVIPPFDPSIADKVFLFRCECKEVMAEWWKGENGEDRKKVWERILSEIPLLRSYLLHKLLKLPEEFEDSRFGVAAWHHPELLTELANLSAENRLMQVIDQVLFPGKEKDEFPQTLKAMDLEQQIRKSEYGFAVEKLLSYSGACGSLLAKLAKSHPERVQKVVREGQPLWRIHPPKNVEENQNGTESKPAF